jgi:hypothetical protein
MLSGNMLSMWARKACLSLSQETKERVVNVLTFLGWRLGEVGPLCPECIGHGAGKKVH